MDRELLTAVILRNQHNSEVLFQDLTANIGTILQYSACSPSYGVGYKKILTLILQLTCSIPHSNHSLRPIWLLALPFINSDPVGALKRKLCHGNAVLSQYQALLSIAVTHWRHNATHHLVLA